jgi:hypothetical protein
MAIFNSFLYVYQRVSRYDMFGLVKTWGMSWSAASADLRWVTDLTWPLTTLGRPASGQLRDESPILRWIKTNERHAPVFHIFCCCWDEHPIKNPTEKIWKNRHLAVFNRRIHHFQIFQSVFCQVFQNYFALTQAASDNLAKEVWALRWSQVKISTPKKGRTRMTHTSRHVFVVTKWMSCDGI